MSHEAIDPAMRVRVQAELDRMAAENRVTILFAIESGSRSWGFPSRDSDYDVRFVYLRPVADYLSVTPQRDVIERPIDPVLDIGGWDLRKALQLSLRSNAALLEWLSSPISYQPEAPSVTTIRQLVADAADPNALAGHYLHLGRRSLEKVREGGDAARPKDYCYALRAACCLEWLVRRHAPPPMDMPSLLAGLTPSDDVRSRVADLVARKANGGEQDRQPHDPVLDRFLAERLDPTPPPLPARDRDAAAAAIDRAFCAIALAQS
ncbi:nucleotidyltransferase domain-containing protein [Niveispirillum sp. KHB5.9]|uniref:nucleotidyltransferase domain-containing protein n=1 Tax=Niveispirillum sp. KHB5.9 TaxID=3400269 RepID=UPI003A8C71A3